MPGIMTMNGEHRSAAAAPLDLRTNRERGTPSGRSPDAPPADSRKRPADKSSLRLPFRKRPIAIESEPEPEPEPQPEPQQQQQQTPAPTPSAEHFCREVNYSFRESYLAHEGRMSPAPAAPRRDADTRMGCQGGYPIGFLYPLPGPCPVYCLRPVPMDHPLTNQTDSQLAQARYQDEDGDTALHIAVVQEELAIVHKLIHLLLMASSGLDTYNNLRQTPLHLAVITKQSKMVEALLRGGADPCALDRNGQTAMHLCCEYNHQECLSVVLICLSSAKRLEIRNYEGLSPLHLAVLRGHRHLSRMLIDAGADINAMDIKSGQTPLMHAVESNNADMVHFLIERGCDVNSQSYSGNTALHIACGRGQVDTVRLLLKSGADSSLKNYHNDTPVMVAKNKKIADVLRGRGSCQIRVQDQHFVSVSPHESPFTENASPSSNHSHGCSPFSRPQTPQCSTSHSPNAPSALVLPFF